MSPEERREILLMVVDEILVDGDGGIGIILAIPLEESRCRDVAAVSVPISLAVRGFLHCEAGCSLCASINQGRKEVGRV